MKFRDFFFLCLGGAALLAVLGLGRACSKREDRGLELAGQTVPDGQHVLDFSQTFTLRISHGNNDVREVPNARILGYTGEKVREPSGKFSSGYYSFGRWLVIQLEDGRKLYLAAGSIVEMVESRPAKTP